jgi:hypothetical protein
MNGALTFGALIRWLRLHAPPLLRRLGVNARRSFGKREVVLHAACLLVLLVLVVFDVQSIIATASVLGMLWAVGQDQGRGRSRGHERVVHLLEAGGKAGDETDERRLGWTDSVRNDEEDPWKLGS